MACIDSLPNEILVKIFSFFQPYQLLIVEKTCSRWRTVIQDAIWDQLTCITDQAIGHPEHDYVHNLIEIVHRVRQVQELYAGVVESLSSSRGGKIDAEEMGKLRAALSEMVEKRAPDAILPLDLYDDILELNHLHNRKWQRPAPSSSEIRAIATQAKNEFGFGEFSAIRIREFDANTCEPDSRLFRTFWNCQYYEVPIDKQRVKKLYLSYLEGIIARAGSEEIVSAHNARLCISELVSLESVELESIGFVLYPVKDNTAFPDVEVKLHFHPHRVQLSPERFKALLSTLTLRDDKCRCELLVQFIEEWKSSGCVQSGELKVNTREFNRIKALLQREAHLEEVTVQLDDPIDMFLSHVLPCHLNKLELTVSNIPDGEEHFLAVLQEKNFLRGLHEFTMSLATYSDGVSESIDWDVSDATVRTRAVLTRLTSSLNTFKTLVLNFAESTPFCPLSVFEPIAVQFHCPLQLEHIEWYDFVCFPLLLSMIEHAPRLNHLAVSSQSFEDSGVGLEWVKKLLSALEESKCLRVLSIDVDEEYQTKKQRADESRRDATHHQHIVQEIDEQVHKLVASLPRLSRISVHLNNCNCHFDLERAL